MFFKHEVTYLGHKCTSGGISPDETKIEAVKKYPIPKNKQQVKSFTAFTNYYRKFIEKYAEITRPLNKLTGKNTPFIWTDECQRAFETLKSKLISKPILQYPDYEKEFTITCDASMTACSAVLSQNVNGHDLPISYMSRTFEKLNSFIYIISKIQVQN